MKEKKTKAKIKPQQQQTREQKEKFTSRYASAVTSKMCGVRVLTWANLLQQGSSSFLREHWIIPVRLHLLVWDQAHSTCSPQCTVHKSELSLEPLGEATCGSQFCAQLASLQMASRHVLSKMREWSPQYSLAASAVLYTCCSLPLLHLSAEATGVAGSHHLSADFRSPWVHGTQFSPSFFVTFLNPSIWEQHSVALSLLFTTVPLWLMFCDSFLKKGFSPYTIHSAQVVPNLFDQAWHNTWVLKH